MKLKLNSKTSSMDVLIVKSDVSRIFFRREDTLYCLKFYQLHYQKEKINQLFKIFNANDLFINLFNH